MLYVSHVLAWNMAVGEKIRLLKMEELSGQYRASRGLTRLLSFKCLHRMGDVIQDHAVYEP